MSDLTVAIDDFEFQDFEIPEDIAFGGTQMLSIKRLIGGRRVIDAMGPDEEPIEWSGRFRGADAASRARALDEKRKAGQPVTLSWGEFHFTVVIARLHLNFQRFYEIPYSISLEVLSDDGAADSGPGIDEMLSSDNLLSQGLGALVGDSQLTGLLGQVNSAIGAIPDFGGASRAALSRVLAPVTSAQARVEGLLSDVSARAQRLTSFGGLI